MSDLKAKQSTQTNHDVGVAAMEEFDLRPVGLDQPGAPNLGYIANLHAELEDAVAMGDLGAIINAADRLGRLHRALQAWKICVWEEPAWPRR